MATIDIEDSRILDVNLKRLVTSIGDYILPVLYVNDAVEGNRWRFINTITLTKLQGVVCHSYVANVNGPSGTGAQDCLGLTSNTSGDFSIVGSGYGIWINRTSNNRYNTYVIKGTEFAGKLAGSTNYNAGTASTLCFIIGTDSKIALCDMYVQHGISAQSSPEAGHFGSNVLGNAVKAAHGMDVDGPSLADSEAIYNYVRPIDYDPYEAGVGQSEPGGTEDATFDFTSTPIALPGLPTTGAYDTGFTTMYNPTAAQLKQLANYLWAGAFDVDNFKKLFADPMDAFIGLSLVPLVDSEIPGSTTELVVGNIGTGIQMKRISQQYKIVSCGTIQVPPKWGAYLDYAPYTKLQLYLPYIGIVDIAPDDIINGTMEVQYTIDLMSGSAIACVKCKDHVLYTFGANCSCPCPITSGQYKNGAIGGLEIIGGIASTASQMVPSPKSKKANALSPFVSGAGAVSNFILNTFETTQEMLKPSITRAGSIGSSNGLMGIQIPYLILTVPRMCIPGSQNTYIGYPSFITKEIGEMEGFSKMEVTHLQNMSCTQTEVNEIISLLEEGVIL